jgi:hypothetical protein
MNINDYAFGKITINGKGYSKDVIIYHDHVFSPWWRKEGHLLQIEDLSDIVKVEVSKLIIGTGYFGTMRVPDDTKNYLTSRRIEVIVKNTDQAVRVYNDLSSEKTVVAALHLTC